MTRDDVIAFLRTNTAGFLATVAQGEPRVRGMMHYITAAGDIVYHTSTKKELAQQVPQGAPVELCIFDPKSGMQVRVRGVVDILTDPTLKAELLADRPFLAQILEASGHDTFLMFRVAHPQATHWSMAENMAPKEFIDL